MIEYRKPWTRQPQGLVRPADDYADMQVGWMPTTGHHNIGALPNWTRQGTPTKIITKAGRAEFSSSYTSNNRYTGASVNPNTANWPGVTVVAKLFTQTHTSNTYPSVLGWVPVGEFYGGYLLSVERDFSGKNLLYWRVGDSTNQLTSTTYASIPSVNGWEVGEELTIVAGWDKSTIWMMVNRNGSIVYNENAHVFGWRNSTALHSVLGYFRSTNRTLPHALSLAAAIPRDLRRDALKLAENPWRLFAPRRIWVPQAGSPDISLAITGQSSTVSASTVTPQVDATRALAGEQLTAAQGTLTATQDAVQTLSGEAATAAAGTLAPSITVALAGSEATTAAGTIGAGGDVSQSLSGEESTVSAGTVGLTVSASRALTGQELTTAQGTIAATQAAVVDLTGEAVTSAAGTVGVTSSSSQALTGEASTLAAGTVAVSTSASVALTGEASTTAIGTVTPSTGATEALSGSAVTTAAGTLGVASSSTVSLAGEQIVISSGTIAAATPDVTLALSGLTISALLTSIYLEGVWVPVEDENSNLWTAVNDSNANAWTVI